MKDSRDLRTELIRKVAMDDITRVQKPRTSLLQVVIARFFLVIAAFSFTVNVIALIVEPSISNLLWVVFTLGVLMIVYGLFKDSLKR